MKTRLLAGVAAAMLLAAPASASGHTHAGLATAGVALRTTARRLVPQAVSTQSDLVTCPAGVPVQTITVVNQANVRPKALALVERATVDQSIQVHAAWGTPCVQFGPGGWSLTLTPDGVQHNSDGSTSMTTGGRHCGPLGTTRWTCYSAQPSLLVQTATLTYATWARAFTHEVAEALVDPTDGVEWRYGLVEVCDPVEDVTYPLDGVNVSDFAFPSYFTGAPGPYDETGALNAPAVP